MRKVVSAYVDATREQKLADLPFDQFPEPFMEDELLIRWARGHMVNGTGQLSPEQAATAFFCVGESE